MDELPRLLLADDDPVFLDMMGRALESTRMVTLVDRVSSGALVFDVLRTHRVDVLLLDIDMPGVDGISIARVVSEKYRQTRIVMLTAFGQEDDLARSVAAGAAGFITKDVSIELLMQTVLEAANGSVVLSPRPAELMLDAYRHEVSVGQAEAEFAQAVDGLPPYLREVAALVGEAAPNKVIARRLQLTQGSVGRYVSEVLKRTGCGSRVELAIRMARAGY